MYYKFDKETLTYKKIKWISLLFKTLGVLSFIFVIMAMNLINNKKEKYTEEDFVIILNKYNEFTPEKLIQEIKDKNYKFPHIVFAQAKLETNNFTSELFKINNNLFGMRKANKRITTSKEAHNNYAYYDNWRESLEDYGYYYSTYLNKINTEEEYYNYLSQYYAEDPEYVFKLKKIIDSCNLKNLFKN